MLLSFAKHGSQGLHKTLFRVGCRSVSDPVTEKLRSPEPGAHDGKSRVHPLPVSEMHRDEAVKFAPPPPCRASVPLTSALQGGLVASTPSSVCLKGLDQSLASLLWVGQCFYL